MSRADIVISEIIILAQAQKRSFIFTPCHIFSWLGGSVVERCSLTGEVSLVCTGPAADG